MSDSRVRKLISRTIEGVEALVDTESGEIFIDVPADDPRYIRLEEEGTVREGDIRSRAEKELESPSLRKWTVETIGRETVVGRDQETGERHEWDRESLEKQLATGGLSASLTDFDRVNVIEGSNASNSEGSADAESVIVAVFGNDGRRFMLTYRPVDDDAGGDGRRVELTDSDEQVKAFAPDLRERFEQAVERELRSEGYRI